VALRCREKMRGGETQTGTYIAKLQFHGRGFLGIETLCVECD